MIADLDLVIRDAECATASDVWHSDVGICQGRIEAIGPRPPAAKREIDAEGRLVLPGGIDPHRHIDQLTSQGLRTADDFTSGTVSAAFGGTTTILSFAVQPRGESLRDAVDEYHDAAEGKAVSDYAFHMIVTDPTPQVLGQELPALIRNGHMSIKVYMTYDALRLQDRQALDVLDLARREGGRDGARRKPRPDWLGDRAPARTGGTPSQSSTRSSGRPSRSVRRRIARSRWPNRQDNQSTWFTSRPKARCGRSQRPKHRVCESSLKPARNIWFSRHATSIALGSRARIQRQASLRTAFS